MTKYQLQQAAINRPFQPILLLLLLRVLQLLQLLQLQLPQLLRLPIVKHCNATYVL